MRIAVMGLGYVGMPLAAAFAEAGADVVGVDIDAARVQAARDGTVSVHDPTLASSSAPPIEASTDAGALRDADAVVLCVPTPLTPNREPDLGPLLAATAALAAVLREGQLVVLESTTFPGTTRELVAPRLEESGLRAGVDFNLAYSPERLDPGSVAHGLRTTPKLVAGLTPACTERARDLYLRVCDEVIALTSPDTAEFTKLLENVFRSVNIALVNELAVLADRMGIDIWEVVDAAATKPFGFMTFRPGPGMGGHCLPVDPFYLAWRAREFDVPCEFVELAGKVNQRMPQYCAERVQRALNDARRPVRDSRILLLGVAYKAGIADVRESPALKLLDTLTELGGDVAYHDDHVPELAGHGLRSRDLDEAVAWADAVVIVTAHPEVDHDDVARRARLLVDLRGVTRDVASPTVVKL
jgi:UDP-N-acetyl-D-glucosamine dehydrogenase